MTARHGGWDAVGRMMRAGLAAALLAAPGLSAQERVGRDDCRCVDSAGNELERCFCFATPEIDLGGMLAFGRRAVLGVNVRQDQPAREDERGVRLYGVDEDSPASEAGLAEDDVVVSVDGRSLLAPLAGERDEERLDGDRSLPVQRLLHLLGGREPGDSVRIEYLRDGERRTATVELGEPRRFVHLAGPRALAIGPRAPRRGVPAPPAFHFAWGEDCPGGEEAAASSRRGRVVVGFGRSCVGGVELIEMRAGLAEYFGAADGGVLVADVRADNPLGLRAGDVLVAVDGRAVSGADQALRVLRSYDEDEDIRLRVLRRQESVELVGRLR